MKLPKLVRNAGFLALAFSLLGFFGNFVQWRNAKRTTAKILNAEKQWARGGSGHFNLDIEYSIDGEKRTGEAAVSAARLEDGVDEIDVFYKPDSPERVIPVDVLKTKQRDIYIAAIVGVALTILGFLLNLKKNE